MTRIPAIHMWRGAFILPAHRNPRKASVFFQGHKSLGGEKSLGCKNSFMPNSCLTRLRKCRLAPERRNSAIAFRLGPHRGAASSPAAVRAPQPLHAIQSVMRPVAVAPIITVVLLLAIAALIALASFITIVPLIAIASDRNLQGVRVGKDLRV
jgi:hypothetical protein